MNRTLTSVMGLGISLGVAAALIGAPAGAAVYTTSFERPDYMLGELQEQNDWLPVNIGSRDVFLVDDSMARTGNQSLRIQHPGSGDSPYHTQKRVFDTGGNRYFEMSGWFYMDPDAHHYSRHTGFRMEGLSGATGQILGIAIDGSGTLRAGTAVLGLWGSTSIVEEGRRDDILGRWIRMHLFADLVTGDATASWSGLGTSAGDSTVIANFNNGAAFSYFSRIALVDRFNQGGSFGQGLMWMDDFAARAFPSPGPVAVFGLAGLIAARRRR